jgi:predicted AlkP superfamily phosphohydrolase/phosphomutase
MTERRKVVAVGLDGLSLDLIQPWIESGDLPFFRRVLEAGASGPLKTVFPPVTAAAWSSIVTGRNPARHGIFEFLQRAPGETVRRAVNASFMQGETLWDVLSRNGRRVCVVNIPVTFPPREVNGWMVSGFLTPQGNREFTYPASLLDDLESRFGPYQLYHHEVYRPAGVQKVIDELHSMLDFRRRTGLHLLEAEDWDLFVINFLGTDRVQHELWHLWDESHFRHSPGESGKYLEGVKDFFRSLDSTLEEFSRSAGPDSHFMLFSDHGLGPLEYFVNFNIWLLKRGYLKLKRNPVTLLKSALFFGGLTPSLIYRIAMHTGLAKLRLKGGLGQRRKVINLMKLFFLSMSDVDWSRTRAWSEGNYGQIFINLEGRDPRGIVGSGAEYDELVGQISSDLLETVDPRTGEKLIGEIFDRDKYFDGPLAGMAPDVSFTMRDMRYKALGVMDFGSRHFIEEAFGNSGDHRMHGLFTLTGPGVRGGETLEGARVLDVTPTILYLLGVPIPDDVDGKVIDGAFDESYIAGHEAAYSTAVTRREGGTRGLDESEDQEIKERLKSLGYLG